MITVTYRDSRGEMYIDFIVMLSDFINFSEDEKTTFSHQIKEKYKVELNDRTYEFNEQDWIHFKRYHG